MTEVFYTPETGAEPCTVSLNEKESLLDGLLRAGYDIPYGCKSGVCQSCLVRAVDGNIPAAAQKGLKPSQVDQQFLLSCCCYPTETLSVSQEDAEHERIEARVMDVSKLNASILRLRIEKVCDFFPGQFFTLWKDDKTARCYSSASVCSTDDFIEFHIKRIAGGAFSDWAWQELSVGDSLSIQGPMGECYYSTSQQENPLLLAGIGTGLAPLYGIIREALRQQHRGKIELVVGSNDHTNNYLLDELFSLKRDYANFNVHLITKSENPPSPFEEGDIYELVKTRFSDLKGFHVYLCGAESFVKKMKKQCFLAGAGMRDIHSDPFIAFA